ncbi:MAG: metallophosphoesterase family protein [Methanobacteriota archaeon]|nr:MAG: metallophosphoesterase family protein [Euryarchaeota archaeon]
MMKDVDILVCSDLHGSKRAKKLLRDALEDDQFDVVVICGDFTTGGSTKYVHEVLKLIDTPLLAVPGNCDSVVVASLLQEQNKSVHSRRVDIAGVKFFGFGGAPPSPHHMPFEVEEGIMAEKLRSAAVRGGVMVTHTPAYGMNDLSSYGHHMGSKAILEVAKEFRPRLALSGHIHESRGSEVSKGTMFVNPGAAKDGYYAKVRLGKNVRTVMCSV